MGLHKNMKPIGSQAVEAFICHPELRRRGHGFGTSKGRRTIDRKMKRVNVW